MPKTLIQAICYSFQTGNIIDIGFKVDFNSYEFYVPKSASDINCLSTRGLFMRWQDLQQIGGFYTHLLPHYLSDYEFTIRAYRKGFILNTHPDLTLCINENTTGFHPKGKLRFINFFKTYFSRKSSSNKIDWTVFILLTSPKNKIVVNLMRIWFKGLFKLFIRK